MPDSTAPSPLIIAGARPWTCLDGGMGVPVGGAVDVHVSHGRISAIVPAATGVRAGAPAGRVIDAAGAWIGPGFVDAHVHLVMAGLGLRQVDLSNARSRADVDAAVGARAREMDRAGSGARAPAGEDAWLIARGWDESRWGGTRPAADWLAAAGDRPAAAWRMDIHAVVVNRAGLARLDLREPVPGGTIVRGADGQPTGLLLEAAAWERLRPALPPPTVAEERAAVRAAVAHAHARGLVAVGSMEELDVVERALVPLAGDATLCLRLLALDRELPLDLERMTAIPSSPMLRLFAAKAFVDGTLGSRTARMLAPYADAPEADDGGDDRGLLVERARDGTLDDWARSAAGAGWGIAIHAIGDEAVRLALDAADAADADADAGAGAAGAPGGAAATGPAAPRRRPVRIEHAQHVDARDLARFAGRFASVQPAHRMADRAVMDERLGAERAAAAFPLAELAAAGARLAFGSDWPVIDCDPMDAIAAAVAGLVREGARPDGHEIDVRAAIAAHTTGAWASIDEPARGRVAPGAIADLVLLDRDPGAAAVDWITTRPAVLATVAGGRVVFER